MKKFIFPFVLFLSFGLFAQEEAIKTIEQHLLLGAVNKGSTNFLSLEERMEELHVPGVSVAVVIQGSIAWTKGYGVANARLKTEVNDSTLFQAGSISKPVAAVGVLKLVDRGLIDLDEDVNTYLKTWKVPESEYTKDEKVTLRRLLSHTAGLNVHGFPGYPTGEELPSLPEVLNGEGNTDSIVSIKVPGTKWKYSGGGYEIMEQLVEDVTGKSFVEYMQEEVLDPWGMTHSTYAQPLPEHLHTNASAAFSREGKMDKQFWNNYPEHAAAGLWTTPTDLAKFSIEIQKILAGKTGALLKRETVVEMLTKGMGNWGLGFSRATNNGTELFGHGGKNFGFTNDFTAFMEQGDAVIVMTNGDAGMGVIQPLMRSISAYYKWRIYEPVVFHAFELSGKELKSFEGKYVIFDPTEGLGEYYVKCKAVGGELHCTDPNGRTDRMVPLGKSGFIDLETGTEVEFSSEGDNMNFVWGGSYTFKRQK